MSFLWFWSNTVPRDATHINTVQTNLVQNKEFKIIYEQSKSSFKHIHYNIHYNSYP